MDNSFDFEFTDDHITITLDDKPPLSDAEREAFWQDLRAACDQHGTHRVLVEGHVPTGEPETAEIVAAGLRTAKVPNLWLAFHLEGYEPSERSQLFKAISASRGVHVKFFSDHEHALNWLRNNSPD